MRWRTAAAAAAGVVAAVTMHAHQAAAEAVDESAAQTPPDTTTTTTEAPSDLLSDRDRAKFAEANAAVAASAERPDQGPVRSKPKVITFAETVEPAAPAVSTAEVAVPRNPTPRTSEARPISEVGAPGAGLRASPAPRSSTGPDPAAEPTGEPLSPAPVDDRRAGGGPVADPISAAVTSLMLKLQPSPKATPPASADTAATGEEWYPAWAAEEADRRIAEEWRTAPVRGPPPTTATALGNSSTNTVTQVAVVRTPLGTDVAVTTQVQNSEVTNVGVATAQSHGGSATAVGNTADTTVIQVSVIVYRGGTGTASIEQNADVDNVGVASATAGAGDANAVGNDSSTNVTQIAVVYLEGSGDAEVTQSTEVDNVGVAEADATGRSATAVGNQSTTDVTQVAVVHVGDDDKVVDQSSSQTNVGVALATGGTASGNTATNTTVQVAKVE